MHLTFGKHNFSSAFQLQVLMHLVGSNNDQVIMISTLGVHYIPHELKKRLNTRLILQQLPPFNTILLDATNFLIEKQNMSPLTLGGAAVDFLI